MPAGHHEKLVVADGGLVARERLLLASIDRLPLRALAGIPRKPGAEAYRRPVRHDVFVVPYQLFRRTVLLRRPRHEYPLGLLREAVEFRHDRRDPRIANVREPHGIVLHRGLRLCEKRARLLRERGRVPGGRLLVEYADVLLGVRAHVDAHLLEIFPDEGRARAVVAREEAVQERLLVQIGIPHELGAEPGLELAEVRVAPARSLHEHVLDVVLAIGAYVGLERMLDGHGILEVAVVRGIVPDVKMLRELAPRLEIVHELGIPHARAIRDRMGAPAFDRTEARHDIVPRARDLRRRARVLVDERLHEDVRTLLLDLRRDGVHEPQQRSRMRAFLFVHGRALGAAAIYLVVVLADADHARVWIGGQPVEHVGHHDLQHVRIGEARLRLVAAPAPAVHLAEVLGMRLEPHVRRDEALERMGDPRALRIAVGAAAEFHRDGGIRVVVVPEPHRKPGIARDVAPRGGTHGERGDLGVVEIGRHGERFALRHDFACGRVPSAPAEALEQFVHAVQDASHVRAEDQDAFPLHDDPEAIGAETGHVEVLAKKLLRETRVAEENRLLRQRLRVGAPGKPHARDQFHVVTQFLAGVLHGLGRRLRNDERTFRRHFAPRDLHNAAKCRRTKGNRHKRTVGDPG